MWPFSRKREKVRKARMRRHRRQPLRAFASAPSPHPALRATFSRKREKGPLRSRALSDWILWVKAAHVASVIAWMAGLFYLPRLFVYHVDAPKGSPQSETFKVMERRLLKAIINPAMIAVWITGPILAIGEGAYRDAWLHAKFLLVLILSGFHGYLVGRVRAFANDANTKPARFYRIINEVPTVLMLLIVILVVVKPF